MTLDRRTAQQQIALIIIIPKSSQILNAPQGCLAVRDSGVEIMLLAVLVDAEALEVDVTARSELRFHGAGNEDWGLEAEVGEAIFDHIELDGDDAGHFNRAWKLLA